jgi:PsbP-like protein/Short C-terminal domain
VQCEMSEWIQRYDMKYMGGHVEYPKPSDCRLYLYYDRIEIENPDLVIPYNAMRNIVNMDEQKISAKRVVGLGLIFVPLAIVGAMWKKNHIYTVIEFKDAVGDKAIILDFGKLVDDLQGWIYRRMLSISRSSSKTYREGDSMTYENHRYGFKMKYPLKWIIDEFYHKSQDYDIIVEFRSLLESKSPFVTLYINDIDSKHTSFQDFVNKEIEDRKNDSKMSIIESSTIVVNDKPAVKLVDVEYEGYKRMVTWIPSDKVVYEISYSCQQEQYLDYLPIVEEMVNSFQISNFTLSLSSESHKTAESKDEDPLLILKRRFAKGELDEEEYLRMRKILES